jgi:hypothetical protein
MASDKITDRGLELDIIGQIATSGRAVRGWAFNGPVEFSSRDMVFGVGPQAEPENRIAARQEADNSCASNGGHLYASSTHRRSVPPPPGYSGFR